MKSFKHLLQNACEDYFTALDHEPTLNDVMEVCQTEIANVVWKALALAQENRNVENQAVVNGIPVQEAKKTLNRFCKTLLGKPVGSCINGLIHLFKLCPEYGFKFYYGVDENVCTTLKHSPKDTQHIVLIGFDKK